MAKFSGAETIRFIQALEGLLKDVFNATDVQIIIDVSDPEQLWGDVDESLLETTKERSTDRAS